MTGTRKDAGERAAPDLAPGTPLDELAALVARLRRSMRRAARAAQPASQLSVAQVELLTVLHGRTGIRAGDVATSLRMAPNSVSTLAQGLETIGMLYRSAGVHDRRTVELTLSAAGIEAVRQWQATNATMLGAALGGLADHDRTALAAALPAIRSLIDGIDEAVDAAPPDAP